MTSDNEWTVVVPKSKKNKQKRETKLTELQSSQVNGGINFEVNRPSERNNIFTNEELSDDEEEENEENIILESPLTWHKFALIGDINIPINMVLIRFNIFPSCERGRLKEIGNRIFRGIWRWKDGNDCDNDLNRFAERCNKLFKFVSIIPNFTSREYGNDNDRIIYFVHVRFDEYFLAEERPRITHRIDDSEYYGFLGDKPTHDPVSTDTDDVKDNRINFMRIMKIVEGKMKHDKFQDLLDDEPDNLKKKPYYTPMSKEDLMKNRNSIHKCQLYLEDSFSGYGVILDEVHLERKIYLHNRRNCYQAFNQDIVNIMVFSNIHHKKSKNSKEHDIWSGRVVSVEHSDVKPVNKIFLCKMTFGHSNLMIPICKTIPVIDVDNRFAEERVKLSHKDLINGLQDVNGIENLIQRKVPLEKYHSFANKSFVTIKYLADDLSTTVQRIQYVDCFRCDFIFLVIYRHWTRESNFPFGEIVGLYTPDATFSKTLPLISVSCDLSVISLDDEADFKSEVKKIKVEALKSRQQQQQLRSQENPSTTTDRKIFTFRYKNQPFNEIAYSYENLDPNLFRIGIHVSNVDKIVRRGEYLDQNAMKQFFTYLLPFIDHGTIEDLKPSYLYSEAVTNGYLSINRDRDVSVISVYFIVDKGTHSFDGYPDVVSEQIRLDDEFDAEIVDELISGESIPYSYLAIVYRACFHNRKRRLRSHCIPPTWFFPDFKLKVNLSTFIIANELEVLANRFVRELLSRNQAVNYLVTVNKTILHRTKFTDWTSKVMETCCLKMCPTLTDLFPNNRHQNGINTMGFSEQFLEKTVSNSNVNLFKCDMLFPDVSFYFYKLKSIFLWNSVKCRTETGDADFTVSITRPLSCFNDLLMQRLLICRQTGDSWDYSDAQIDQICQSYTENNLILTKYGSICRAYEIKDRFENCSFTLDCVYDEFTDETIVFNHPFLHEVYHDNFIFFELLGLNQIKQQLIDDVEHVELEWRTRIFVVGSDFEDHVMERNVALKDIYHYEGTSWRTNLHQSEITDRDRERIYDIREDNKYPINITSETSKYMDPKLTLSLLLKPRQILRIQFNYSYRLGIMKISPELLIVNPHLRVCLCHRQDPFKYFIHPSNLNKINYRRFQDLENYKEQFRILNRIEGIHQTISDQTSYFVHEAEINWIGVKTGGPVNDVYGVVLLEESWCKERFIKLGHRNLKIQDPVFTFKKAVKNNKMDFIVCIQSFLEDKNVYWLGHALIADVAYVGDKSNKKLHLTLKLNHSNFPIKPIRDQRYSLEILETPITNRVLDRNLRRLDEGTLIGSIVMKHISNASSESRTFIDYDREIASCMTHPYQLNRSQFNALKIAISREFSLIWGPPGTGKTMVGCIIAFAFSIINRRSSNYSTVLYCGPSNQSVNVVAEKLMNVFGDKCPKLLRIYSSDVMNADFPYPGAIINNEINKTPDFLKPITLHHIIRQINKPFAKTLQQFECYFEANKLRSQVSRAEFAKMVIKYNKKVQNAFMAEIESGKYEIILCTTVGSCKKILDSFEINQVIVDESGMCSEPEALGPAINRKALKNILFIGDHKQLRPIVTCPAAVGKQFNLSLFERIYEPSRSYCTMLNEQYRMHPSICEFPSSHFYQHEQNILSTALSESWTGISSSFIVNRSLYNGLQYRGLRRNYDTELVKNNVKIADHIWKGIRRANFRCFPLHLDFSTAEEVKEKILFINVEGSEVNQAVSGATGSVKSKGNKVEVRSVCKLYESLIGKMKNKKCASEIILVITQYRLQEHLLKQGLTEILEKLNLPGPPRVSTVVKSQGSECDYVIFSTVRSLPHSHDIDIKPSSGWISKYLGFITDKNQFNVAITRAKKGLFIMGNKQLLSVNQDWKSLINDLENRGCVSENIFEAVGE